MRQGGSLKFRQYRGRHLWMATRDADGRTPMHLAAFYNNTEVAKLLLEKGANANAVNNDGQTPGDLAKRRSPRVYDVIKAYQRRDEDDGE